MSKCIGNCVQCDLDVDKPLCYQYQTLRLLVEVKAMLKELALPKNGTTLGDFESEKETNKESIL